MSLYVVSKSWRKVRSKLVGSRTLAALRATIATWSNVRLAYVFGSGARGELRADSDLDIGMLFDVPPSLETRVQMISRLEEVAGCSVDLIVLNRAAPLLLREVLSEGNVLHLRDEDERVVFEQKAWARYLDTQHLRAVQYAYLRERLAKTDACEN